MNNFITNTNNETALKKRIKELITVSEELKFLIGFFYFSGWQEVYQSLQKNEAVVLKILVGLKVDKFLSSIVEHGESKEFLSNEEQFTEFINSLNVAINNAEMDNEEFYNQVYFFIELLEKNRLIIRKTLEPNHAKLYLFKLQENVISNSLFITGSSNLTKAGLSKQNEFNVEIKDYGFNTAENYFDKLWETAIPITEAVNGKEIIIDFLKNKTQASIITPFEAYAYILKTYLELYENKKVSSYIYRILEENGFEKYSYQIDAVNQALNVLDTYNGVIIADVVGLGKSIIASLIAGQMGKRGLILCPPGLIGDKNQGTGWWEYWRKFRLFDWDIESTGNIENVAQSLRENDLGYEVVIVDEAHKFRNQDTAAYEALSDICRGKQVILLTATPFNNSPADIFSLLKLFIVPGQSGITIEPDLEGRFQSYNYRFRNLSFILKNHNSLDESKKSKAEDIYIKMFGKSLPIDINFVRENVNLMANDIKNVISPVIIRRNRIDLKEDFEYKKEIANLSEIEDPRELFFELSKEQSIFYDRVIKEYFAENGWFKGAIYQPFEYEAKLRKKDELSNRAQIQQKNLFDFMRRLLVKRFESSFGAFSQSIDRFLRIHKMVKEFIDSSGKYILDRKIIDSIYNDDENADSFTEESIKEALKEFKNNSKGKTSPKHTKIYDVNSFKYKEKFLKDIESDILLFESVKEEINKLSLIENDPKRKKVVQSIQEVLSNSKKQKRKIIVFTEYTDTVNHLKEFCEKKLNKRVLFCSGNISKQFSLTLESNFNAKFEKQEDDYDVLITSDKLSEGFNLNRAGLIINYDIPWNPTRVIQRIGRINRIGNKVFDKLFIYNFFPTEQGASQVKIREIAEQKMFLIHSALGEDAKVFNPDEEPTASGLFKKINSIIEEDDNLNISTLVRNEFRLIKNNYPQVIDKINNLPNRTKASKYFNENNVVVLRKKGMALFSLIAKGKDSKAKLTEIPFNELFKYVKCSYDCESLKLTKEFWKFYESAKSYKPKYRTGRADISIEKKAIASLKSLLNKKQKLDNNLVNFIGVLIKDIKYYKILSKYTLRKLVLSENQNYNLLLENIKILMKHIGANYLDDVLKRVSNINDDVIIAVENRIDYKLKN